MVKERLKLMLFELMLKCQTFRKSNILYYMILMILHYPYVPTNFISQ